MKSSQWLIWVFCCASAGSAFAQQTHNVAVTISQPPQLVANAGVDITSANDGQVNIGGSPAATGGTPPYGYAWSPSTNIADPSVANPVLNLLDAAATYTLTVTDSKGCSASDQLNVLVTIVAVDDPALQISVYPNPGHATVVIASAFNHHIRIADQHGKLMKDFVKASEKVEVDVSAFPKGLYVLTAEFNGKKTTVKLMIR
jgi:hypothetical protein